MLERLHSYSETIPGAVARSYTAHVLGRQRADGTWEASLLFEPSDNSPPLETDAETTQPDRDALIYWASGLDDIYLEGALRRAEHRQGSASTGVRTVSAPRVPPAVRAVLNPFEVYQQGEDILRQELSALSPVHLQNIIRAYALGPVDPAAAEDRDALVAKIVGSVRGRMEIT